MTSISALEGFAMLEGAGGWFTDDPEGTTDGDETELDDCSDEEVRPD